VDLRLTTGPGDARVLAEEALRDGIDLLLVAGGDGTVNEAAAGLLGGDLPLGVVPVGSGNGLGRALGVPLQVEPALAALEAAEVRRMDVGRINGRPFLNVAGIGFDAAVGRAFHQAGAGGGRRGVASYVRMSFGLVLGYRAGTLVLEAGDGARPVKPFVLVVANGPQYGGGAIVNPGARLDDGRFEVVVFEDSRLVEVLWNVPRLFLGRLDRSRRYHRFSADRVVVASETPVEHHRDGEPEDAATRYEVALVPRDLPVLVPRAALAGARGPFRG
jgi:YegS/Rv2252/BmrU family lipid kinase